MAANSSLGSVRSLLPVQVAQRDPGDNSFPGPSRLGMANGNQGSRQVGSVSFEGPSGQGPRWANYNVYLHYSRTRSMWLKPSSGPNSSSLAIRRSTSPRSEDLLSLMRMKTRAQKSGSPQTAVGSNTLLIMVPWHKWQPLRSWEPWHCLLLTHTHQ